MNFFEHKITLDMHCSISQLSISVKKGDTKRKICATLTENGKVHHIEDGCFAVFSAKTGSGAVLYNACTIVGDVIEYEFTESTTYEIGKADCELQLFDANGKLITSPQFILIVESVVCDDDDVTVASEFSAFVQLNEKATELIAEMEDALGRTKTGVSIGSYVNLGVNENGEPILWRCVGMRDGRSLMVSDKVLTYKAFDANTSGLYSKVDDSSSVPEVRNAYGSNNWKYSTLRRWLNAQGSLVWDTDNEPDRYHVTNRAYGGQNGFMSGFTNDELLYVHRAKNVTAVSVADDVGIAHSYSLKEGLDDHLQNYYTTACVQETEEYFFCLNTPELIELGKNIDESYAVAEPTDYAKALPNPNYVDDEGWTDKDGKNHETNYTYYWLRDAYAIKNYPEGARCMFPGGHLYYANAHNGNIGVRPAFVLEKGGFKYGDGSVDNPYRMTDIPRANKDKDGKFQPDKTVKTEAIPTRTEDIVGTSGTTSVVSQNGIEVKIGQYFKIGNLDGEDILWRAIDICRYQGNYFPLLLSDKILRFYCFDARHNKPEEGGINKVAADRYDNGGNRWATSSLNRWLNSRGTVDWDGTKSWNGVSVAVPSKNNVNNSPYDTEAGFLTYINSAVVGKLPKVTQPTLLNEADKDSVEHEGYEVGNLPRKPSMLGNYDNAYREQFGDRVFLMDRRQAKILYDNFEDYVMAFPTAGAVEQSEYKNSAISVGKTWHYWLRDAYGKSSLPYYVHDITTDGRSSEDTACNGTYGVRPCVYVNAAKSDLSGSGTRDDPYIIVV